MKTSLIATLAVVALAVPAFAGDAAKGEKEFKKCKACHMIQAEDGTDIVKGGKTGPNLYGIVGKPAAHQEGFKYKESIVGFAGANPDFVWTEEELAAYMTDPSAWLEAKLGAKAKSGMTHKQKKDQEDIAAYLASVTQ